ncbi:MAG: Gfo/Idh/MocA family oxidoreductase [bacterium]|nr:Gfo/Idh/MocA family oxidoreductase [bacterium]
MLNIGIIGYGFIGKIHAQHYMSNPNVNRVIIADPLDINRKNAERMGFKTYEIFEDMLNLEKLDAVSICTPHHTHRDIALRVMDFRIPILLEKPAATSREEIKEIIEKAERLDIKVMVAHSLRFSDTFRLAKKLIEEEEIGKILFIIGKYLAFKDYNQYPKWKTTKKEAWGGTLFRDGLHIVDAILWLSGKEIASAKGLPLNLFFDTEVEDTFLGTINFQDGSIAQLSMSSITKGFEQIGLEIYGEKGSIKVNNEELVLYKEDDIPKYIKPAIGASDFWKNQIDHFVDCIINNKEPLVTLKEAEKTMKAIFMLYEL